jgi:hypothetical protein
MFVFWMYVCWVGSGLCDEPIAGLEEPYQVCVPMTPSGIEPETFRFVAQCLNQLSHQQHAHWPRK